MDASRGRTGVSKLAISVVIIVVVVVAGAYVLLVHVPAAKTTSSRSSSSSTLPTVPLNESVDQLIQNLNARNVDSLMTLYSANAVTVWEGSTGGLSGMYTGTANIRLIYATTVGKSLRISANLSDYAQKTITPTQTNATFVIKLISNSTVAGIVTATIDVSEEWNWGSSGWQMSKENWNYVLYDSSFIDKGIPSATTFPQWGYELKGGNPNLVPEKSFEWHAGPYVAASVYALMFGVVALMALRLGSRRRILRPEEQGRR